jgi:hypothetical protein
MLEPVKWKPLLAAVFEGFLNAMLVFGYLHLKDLKPH